MNNKVALFSDLHLGIYGNSENWHKIANEWADWINSDLKSKGIETVFFLGDFFHNRSEISVQTMHVASGILDKLRDFEMYMIVGNHDAYYKNRSDVHSLGLIGAHPNIRVVSEKFVLERFGKRMLFVPWNCELPKDETFDYVFGHFEIQNFKMNGGKTCDHGLQAIDFLSGMTEVVFSGHFHHRHFKKYNEGTIYYIGNTFPMDFSDIGNEKGYYVLDIENGDLEFVENEVSPKFKKVYLSNIKNYTKADIKNNIIRLIVDVDYTEKQIEKIQNDISKHNPFYFNTEYNVVTKAVNDDVEEVESLNLIEQFDEYILQLKLGEAKEKRVKAIIKELYEKNK